MITRRNLIKGGALVGGTVWVAPAIESFVSRASAASPLPKTCCQCFAGVGASFAFVAAGEDDFNDTTCATFCRNAANNGGFGLFPIQFVRFVDGQAGFSSSDTAGPSQGCTYNGPPSLPLGFNHVCPTGLPSALTCTQGTA
jgi:hypothetical protein